MGLVVSWSCLPQSTSNIHDSFTFKMFLAGIHLNIDSKVNILFMERGVTYDQAKRLISQETYLFRCHWYWISSRILNRMPGRTYWCWQAPKELEGLSEYLLKGYIRQGCLCPSTAETSFWHVKGTVHPVKHGWQLWSSETWTQWIMQTACDLPIARIHIGHQPVYKVSVGITADVHFRAQPLILFHILWELELLLWSRQAVQRPLLSTLTHTLHGYHF